MAGEDETRALTRKKVIEVALIDGCQVRIPESRKEGARDGR